MHDPSYFKKRPHNEEESSSETSKTESSERREEKMKQAWKDYAMNYRTAVVQLMEEDPEIASYIQDAIQNGDKEILLRGLKAAMKEDIAEIREKKKARLSAADEQKNDASKTSSSSCSK